MPRWWFAALLAATVGALLVFVVVVDPADDTSVPTGPAAGGPAGSGPSATVPAPVSGPLRRYVALGDSFTAGPLIPYVEAAQTRCLRSSANYPAVLGRWLGARRVVDVSCSGADTRDLRWQRTALTAGTDLVTVGTGGNDFDIFSTLVGRCTALSGSDPLGSPCRDRFAGAAGPDTLLARIGQVEARLARGLRDIVRLVPDAVVAVVGYPRLVPSTGTCADLPLARGDYPWADRVERGLNDALAGAARRVGALFVDTYGPSRGHDVCADDAWVNGRDTLATRALAYHPYEAGMRASAAAAHRVLTGAAPTEAMLRRAERRAGARPPGALTRGEQRIIAALIAGA